MTTSHKARCPRGAIVPFRRCRSHLRPTAKAVALFLLGSTLALWAAESPAKPQIVLVADRADAVYTIGEPIHWRIEGDPAGLAEASYTLRQCGLNTLRQGTVNLASLTTNLESTLAEPGTLLLELKTTDLKGKGIRCLAGVAVAPDRIAPSTPRPDDFDEFWQSKIEELSRTPAQAELLAVDSGREGIDYWKITLSNMRGTHIQGQLARPKGEGKLPAMFIVQWAGVYGLEKSWVTDPATAGWLVLNINAHDLPIDEPPAFYQRKSDGLLKNYPAIGNDDRERSYFLRMYLSCYRAAQYLAERPDWDGKTLLVTGNSQGGMQALMTAGLHPKITAAIAGVPAGCDLTGPVAGRSPGWPGWYWSTQGKDPSKVRDTSRYYDVVNFASRIHCPVLVGVGLTDETCPPAGILAALNQVKGKKEVVLLPRGDHQGSNDSHRKFYERSAAWKTALAQGKPAPAE